MEQIVITKPDNSTINLFSKETGTWVTKAEQKRTLLSEDVVSVSVQSARSLDIEVGDKAIFFGKTYKINTPVEPKKTGEHLFEYNITFESVQYDLLDVMYFDCDETGYFTRSDFALTGNLQFFLQVLIYNTNRIFGSGVWVLGVCPDTDYKDMSFSDQSCLAVLQSLCDKDNGFNQEFDIVTVNGVNTINIRTQGTVIGHTFQYGKGNGFYTIERKALTDKNLLTRLYAFGAAKNLPSSYRNYSTRLKLPTSIGNELSYIQNDTAIALFGIKEATKNYDDIYPNRIGTVSSIVSGNVLKFVDSSMDFDLNEKDSNGDTKWLISGSAAKIHFNTGNLAGYEFDISKYDHSTKTFTLNSYTDETKMVIPSETTSAYQIEAGDKYVILNIVMPNSYVAEAEAKLLTAAQSYLAENSQINVQYAVTIDDLFLPSLNGGNVETEIFGVGDAFPVKDSDFNIDESLRIQSFTRDCLYPFKYTITLSNTVQITRIERVFSSLKQAEIAIQMNNLLNPVKARRGWRDTQELLNMVFDVDGYFTDKIRPLSIETSMLAVGTRAGNFTLSSNFIANYQSDKAKFFASTGILAHLSIEENIRQWNMAQLLATDLVDANAYYLYARCEISGTNGTFVIDTSVRKVDNEGSYYTFPIGVIHSVSDGYRNISTTYGSASIYGRNLKAGAIVNYAGKTLIDIDKAEIYGAVTFKSSEGNEVNVSEAINDVAANVSYKVEITSSNGEAFRNDMIATTLIAKVYKGSEDITATLNQSCFKWVRKSSNTEADTTWNQQHATFYSNILNITSDDVEGKAVFNCEVSI